MPRSNDPLTRFAPLLLLPILIAYCAVIYATRSAHYISEMRLLETAALTVILSAFTVYLALWRINFQTRVVFTLIAVIPLTLMAGFCWVFTL